MGQPFEFIHYAPNLKGENLLSAHVARSHTAKVNRQNLAKRNRTGPFGRPDNPRPLTPASLTWNGHEDQDKCASAATRHGDSIDEQPEPEVQDARKKSKPNHSPQTQTLSSTISPVFGGHTMQAFDLAESGPEAAEVAHYVFNEVFSSCFSHDERTVWLQKFSQYPLVHHAFSYFRLFHQERVDGALSVVQGRKMLDESLHTFRLLNAKLDNLAPEDIEPVLLAMTLMFKDRENLGKENPSENHKLLYSPHMLQTELAGLDIGRVRQTEGYLPAVSLLVDQAGGLSNVRDVGLARIMCMGDLIAASMNFTAPFFQCGWEIDPALLVAGRYWELPVGIDNAGQGFERVSRGMPRLGTFMNLSAVNLAMAQHREQPLIGNDFKALVYARNAAKHQVLSLPTWDALPQSETCGRHRALYECSRLAAVLYANAVVFPTLEDFPGIQEPLRQLRELLEDCDLSEWREGVSELLLWSIFIGGIGAHRSPHWPYFASALRRCTANMRELSSESVKAILRGFVWSDIACDEGATMLWNAIRF